MSNVIGEGSYGCIHSPALKCKDKPAFNKNFVSKSLLKSDAELEKNHINFIKKIDPKFEYHLNTPTDCVLEDNATNKKALEQCSIFNKKDNIRLLIMENGGINLEDYSRQIKTREQAMIFWIKVQKVIKGVKLYIDNGIIHNDIKAQNILFNEKTQKINLIDFGLMHSKKLKKTASKNYDLYKVRKLFNLKQNKEILFLNELHWSWPLENEYIEKSEFKKFIEETTFAKHQKMVEQLIQDIEQVFFMRNKIKQQSILESNKKLETYYHITQLLGVGTQYSIYEILNDYLNNIYITQQEYKNSKNKTKYYEEFLEIHLNTIDVYGLGIAFIACIKEQKPHLSQSFKKDLFELFYRMITPIVKNRISINDLLDTYESIINKYIKEYDYSFMNNVLVKLPKQINFIETPTTTNKNGKNKTVKGKSKRSWTISRKRISTIRNIATKKIRI